MTKKQQLPSGSNFSNEYGLHEAPIKLPSTYKEAIIALLEQIEENEKLKLQLEQIKKSEYPEVLKVSHLAKIMGVSEPTVYAYMKHNDFPALQLGGVARVMRDSFYSWLKSKENKPQG